MLRNGFRGSMLAILGHTGHSANRAENSDQQFAQCFITDVFNAERSGCGREEESNVNVDGGKRPHT